MMKRYLLVAALMVVLAGCSSNVKLDPPIQGSATTGADATASGATGQGAGQSTVTQVQAGQPATDAAGPAGVGRVIYFDFDSFSVKPEYQSLVDQHARFLQGNRGRTVAVEGHTDERGSREYNLALGQKRAEAVRRALTLVGATDAQIEAVSFGEEKPAVSGSTEDAYSQNRRVEIRYR
ncbi:peptidoglycan-associated lipoprotein Pal [Ottowia testudinis]|uniref:Peptidoglycan-associated lipoprotein n=1 Tax=Ottowia testudinis TaxID=2816950 RepID=A0A975CF95_9BURK|nr:peptidoglycan-associated lipoprotein Pal [Ottowia testudinis]QTD44469.1 peptidoglycan-associated lipoprotein Pal [Ottowia testudinis]